MHEEARRKIVKARSELVLEHPFFATLALRLDLREDPSCRSAWSDGKVLAYNPSYIRSLSPAKVAGILCHEVLHLACMHHLRRDGRDPQTWNKACDYAVNPILLDAGIELPPGHLDDPTHHGKNAERIYSTLLDRHDEIKEGAALGGRESLETGETMEGAGGGGEDGAGERDELRDESGNEDSPADELPGAQGENEDGEEPENDADPGMSGEIRDAVPDPDSENGEAELREMEQSMRAALSEALNACRESGDVPGGLERLLGGLLPPALDWRELLRRFLENAARNDFTWLRPNRRHLHEGIYLPGLENMELAEVAVAVDVSGSISQAELDGFAAELSALLEEYDTALTVITCDAAVTARRDLGRWDLPLDFRSGGGGGTNFCPPFRRLAEDGDAPSCLIYFTDLESNHFPEEPAYPVLWVTPNPAAETPPFGEVVHMAAESV